MSKIPAGYLAALFDVHIQIPKSEMNILVNIEVILCNVVMSAATCSVLAYSSVEALLSQEHT